MHPNESSSLPPGLPDPDPASADHKRVVESYLIKQIEAAPYGYMPFEQWMNLALYAPGLGYYAAGSEKFAGAPARGDFTTAPEISPLFGQTLARQVAQVLDACGSVNVLEFGAGSGALAASVIPALRALGIQPVYRILEISADLRERQRQRLAAYGENVQWLDALPEAFTGCVLANEVLDAMPATLFRWADDGAVLELGVSLGCAQTPDHEISLRHRRTDGIEASLGHARIDDAPVSTDQATPFVLTERPASPDLQRLIAARMPCLPGYQSEINRQAEAWIRQMGSWLERGAALLIDYGFPRHEYYHPQRAGGTLMCHFRHHAHSHPLVHAGLQDITTHVDFTAMADAALAGGLDVMGYTSQARFLINSGLPDVIEGAQSSAPQATPQPASPSPSPSPSASASQQRYTSLAGVQQLVSEAEMGELFKVLALGRGLDIALAGFAAGDRRHRL